MKALVVIVIALVACSKKDKDKPAPTPTPGTASAAPVASGSAPVAEGSGSAPAKAEECEIKIALTPKEMTYEGGGIKGTADYHGSTAFAPFKALAGKCAANIKADATTKYQDVIVVMDSLVKEGITDLSVGDDVETPPDKIPPPGNPPADTSGIKGEWKPDGTLVATLDPNHQNKTLQDAPVIIINNKNEATVGGKSIGHADNPDLAATLVKTLPPPKTAGDPAIVQADQGTPYPVIARVIEGAKKAGYQNVLFAVKNK